MSEPTGTLDPVAIREKLLATWLETEIDRNVYAYGSHYFLTAELNGIKLYTRPTRTQTRSGFGWEEVDGVATLFKGEDGSYRWGFDGSPNGQGVAYTFDRVASIEGLAEAEWVVDTLNAAPKP